MRKHQASSNSCKRAGSQKQNKSRHVGGSPSPALGHRALLFVHCYLVFGDAVNARRRPPGALTDLRFDFRRGNCLIHAILGHGLAKMEYQEKSRMDHFHLVWVRALSHFYLHHILLSTHAFRWGYIDGIENMYCP